MIDPNLNPSQPCFQKLSETEMIAQYKKAILKNKSPKFMRSTDSDINYLTIDKLNNIYKTACEEIKQDQDTFKQCNDEFQFIMSINPSLNEKKDLTSFGAQLNTDALKLKFIPLSHESFIEKFYTPIALKHYSEIRINDLHAAMNRQRKEVDRLAELADQQCTIS